MADSDAGLDVAATSQRAFHIPCVFCQIKAGALQRIRDFAVLDRRSRLSPDGAVFVGYWHIAREGPGCRRTAMTADEERLTLIPRGSSDTASLVGEAVEPVTYLVVYQSAVELPP
jgi:hypothetical protein